VTPVRHRYKPSIGDLTRDFPPMTDRVKDIFVSLDEGRHLMDAGVVDFAALGEIGRIRPQSRGTEPDSTFPLRLPLMTREGPFLLPSA